MSDKTEVAKKRGKKYAEKAALLEKESYTAEEACALLPNLSMSKFVGSCEMHININADTTQADQLVRTTVSLPHGTGKTVKIAAFVTDDKVDAAKKAGAYKAGKEDLIKDVEAGNIDFDITVAEPAVMKDLGKIAKTLGQKGLMPNPKAGTVTENVEKAIEELSKGRIECKMDKFGVIHVIIGKTSFDPKQLQENLEAVLNALNEAKPAGIKGSYITGVTLAPTMGPSVKIAYSN